MAVDRLPPGLLDEVVPVIATDGHQIGVDVVAFCSHFLLLQNTDANCFRMPWAADNLKIIYKIYEK